jgi:heat shock protein HspQ
MIIHARNLLRKSFHNRNHQPSHFSGICVFSSSIEKQKVLSKTIYKQIIKWTASTGSDVPFDPIPPLTLVPPRVDASALKTMSELHSTENSGELTREEKHLLALMKSLPSNSIIEPKQLILPIENANHVKNATKLAYALNNFTTESKEDVEQIKERVSLGFEVLKSLNQLSEMLEERKKAREDHQDRGGVSFRVGQVVRHKKNRWRAIVGGWSKTLVDSKEPSQKTSLTNKSYTNNSDGNILGDENVDVNINVDVDVDGHAIEYVVHLDEGDAAHSRVRVLGSMKAKQHELEAVADDDLKRIRNSLVGNHFESFNSMNGEFVPGKILKFEYPADESDAVDILEETRHIMAKHDNAKTILCGVKEIAAKLHRIVLDTSSCAETRKLCFLPDIEERLEQIVTGNLVENVADKILSPMSSSHKVAIQHMSALFYISFQVGDMLWQRHTAEKNSELKKPFHVPRVKITDQTSNTNRCLAEDRILFPLGSVVKHKKYGFRGGKHIVDSFSMFSI